MSLHDGVDHDLGGADPPRGLEEGDLHPVDVVVEVVQRRVERDHGRDLLLVRAVVPRHALALEELAPEYQQSL